MFMRQKSHESNSLPEQGRIAQKLKTREAILAKANQMLKKGIALSVEDVAREAGVSKATAYRYFPSVELLRREASLQVKSQAPDDLFKNIAKDDLKGRIDRLIHYHYTLFTTNEKEFRLFLGSIITESVTAKNPPSRGSRRVVLIEEALEPLKRTVSKKVYSNMVASLSIVFGIESVTILKDICHQSNKDLLDTWKWLVYKIVFEK